MTLLAHLLHGGLLQRDGGAPHDASFAQLERALAAEGPGRPALMIDLDALDHNLSVVRRRVDPGLAIRVVAKSLPSVPLLRHVCAALGASGLMVFDDSLARLAAELPGLDLLVGKPMPIRAVETFLRDARAHAPRVQWLVDDEARLARHLALARREDVRLRVSVEIDVGLHRGGVPDPAGLAPLLRTIAANPEHLGFAGLMGYDAHVGAASALPGGARRAHARAVARYAAFVEALSRFDPRWAEASIRNGGGSKTYALHRAGGPVGEVALGSALVMPTDFDVPALAEHRPAVFLAVPVLKRLEGTSIPFLESAARLWSRLDPSREVTYFLYGGRWLARPISPRGLRENPLYGSSTNQSMWNGSRRTALSPEGTVFFRPTQSERVLSEHGALRLVRGGRLAGTWDVLPLAADGVPAAGAPGEPP